MRTAPRLTVGLILLTLCLAVAAPAGDHALVRLWFDGADGAAFLRAHPELDVVSVKPGTAAEIVATPADLDLLRASGLRLETVHKDLSAHYAKRTAAKDGNFGVWHTWSQNIAYLDSLRTEYPDLISEKWSIGQSHEGRDLWCVRLSDNPDVDETGEPEILLDTMHHAREIMAGEFGIMFADYLCKNYGTDPVVTWLMNNRELYLVSIVNPDGMVYNEQTDPAGGGLWRKNRRDNGDGTWGVDPNRNYTYEWDGPGSGTDPGDITYRGPYAGSEPEIQAMMAFIDSREFVTQQTLHTYSNLTLHPWGYVDSPCPDNATFEHMGAIMTQYNGYQYGYVGDLLSYTVNGGTFDWSYGAIGEHARIFCVSNEIGSSSDGFWPDPERRETLFLENVWPMLYLMQCAGAYAEITDLAATDTAGGLLEPGDQGELSLQITNQGITESLTGAQLVLFCDDPYVQLGEARTTVGGAAPMASTPLSEPLPFTVDPACPDGHPVTITARCYVPGSDRDIPLRFIVGQPTTLFADSFDEGTGDWLLTGQWGPADEMHTAPGALTDSPVGDYANQTSTSATIDGSFQATSLTFWHRYDLEDTYDFGHVQVSVEGGAWETIASYTGSISTWQQETLDLSDRAGRILRIRFLLETDSWITADGWFIDDVVLLGSDNDNQTPPAPPALAPAEDATIAGPVQLTVGNVVDPDGDPVTYGFRVYADALMTQVVARADDVPAGDAEETNWTTPVLDPGLYHWRAYAADDQERGLLGDVHRFTIDDTTDTGGVVIGGPRLAVIASGSDRAELQLSLAQAGDVSVRIYNARGQLVRDLYSGAMDTGSRVLVWDGRDGRGRQAASGVYFVRAEAGPVTLNGRVLMVR